MYLDAIYCVLPSLTAVGGIDLSNYTRGRRPKPAISDALVPHCPNNANPGRCSPWSADSVSIARQIWPFSPTWKTRMPRLLEPGSVGRAFEKLGWKVISLDLEEL